MNRILGPESKFYAALSLFADLVIVNVLLVITCFPVFTGGMSLRTAHAVTGQMVREEGSRRGSAFVRGLLTRPGVNTAWWLISLAVAALRSEERRVGKECSTRCSALVEQRRSGQTE